MADKRTTASATGEQDEELEQDEGRVDADDLFGDGFGELVADALNDEDDVDEDDDEAIDDDDELAIDDEDVDDDLDDDDDLENDEGEEGQPRDEDTGKFVKAGEPAAEGGKPAEGAAPGAAAAAGTEKKTEAAGAATPWEPFAVKVDKSDVPIAEAKISRHNGHVFLAIPEKEYSRFTARIGRGVVGERMSRQLDQGLKELQAIRNAPPAKTDAEIEAELTYEALKPFIADFLDEKDVKLLDAQIAAAKSANKGAHDKAIADAVAKATEEPWEQTQTNLLGKTVIDIVRAVPELHGLTPEQLTDIYENELLPVRNALITREGDEVFGNTEYIFARLKAHAAKTAGQPTAKADAPAPSTTAGKPANSATTASSSSKAVTKAERFNAGVNAGTPRTTSAKANRGSGRPANGATRNGTKSGKKRVSEKTLQRRAEDKLNKEKRAFLNSADMDFGTEQEE